MADEARPPRRIRDESDARACLAAVEASGMRLYGWARSNGVAVRSLGRWRERVALVDAQARRVATQSPVRARESIGEAEARRLLAEWERVGGPLAVFCRDVGVPSDTLYRWRARLAETTGTDGAPRLVEVTVPVAPMVEVAARYNIVVGRFRVVVREDFADATLARLLRVVASC